MTPAPPRWAPALRVVPDVRPGRGALGGIHTAVLQAPAPVVIVAWDMPFVTAGADPGPGRGGSTVTTRPSGERAAGGGVEPMCAAYGPACRARDRRPAWTGGTSGPSPSMPPWSRYPAAGRGAAARRSAGTAVLQRQHSGRPRQGECAVGATRIISVDRPEERGEDDARRGARQRIRPPGPPGHDDQARHPPRRASTARAPTPGAISTRARRSAC